jgi:hypothetical protein
MQGKLATILQDGYQDLIKQITSSITVVQASGGVPGLVRVQGVAPGSSRQWGSVAAVALSCVALRTGHLC